MQHPAIGVLSALAASAAPASLGLAAAGAAAAAAPGTLYVSPSGSPVGLLNLARRVSSPGSDLHWVRFTRRRPRRALARLAPKAKQRRARALH